MDMFVYGCPRVLRYLSLLNHTVVLYDQQGILDEINITQKQLRQICILSGTDYNITLKNDNDKKTTNLYNTLKHFDIYKKENSTEDFYLWLINNTQYITNNDLLNKIYCMFDLINNQKSIEIFEDIKIMNGPIDKIKIKEILKKDGFLFPLK